MARFLHIADVHLGFDRYNSPERTKDFYFALHDVLQRYAIAEQVDFVLIAGDLFEHRVLHPAILNQAQLCFQDLKTAGIPVFAIEGNHDNTPYGTSTSWLKYLSQWGMIHLLEPGNLAQGEPLYRPWDGKRGGYIDLTCGVRILGSAWYGASATQAIAAIAAAIPQLPPSPGQTILMFHHGLEGQIARYSGALRYAELLPLKEAGVDYLALGHIHKNYTEGGWIFNPGSLEANNVEEGQFVRGAYLVEITSAGISAELKTDYRQRAIVRLRLTLKGEESEAEVVERAIAEVEGAIAQQRLVPADAPIVELRIEGLVGFNRFDLDIRQLQAQLQTLSNALIFLLKYEVDEKGFDTPTPEEASREEIERSAFLDLLEGHRDYKKRSSTLATALVDLKNRCLSGHSEEALYRYVDEVLQDTPS